MPRSIPHRRNGNEDRLDPSQAMATAASGNVSRMDVPSSGPGDRRGSAMSEITLGSEFSNSDLSENEGTPNSNLPVPSHAKTVLIGSDVKETPQAPQECRKSLSYSTVKVKSSGVIPPAKNLSTPPVSSKSLLPRKKGVRFGDNVDNREKLKSANNESGGGDNDNAFPGIQFFNDGLPSSSNNQNYSLSRESSLTSHPSLSSRSNQNLRSLLTKAPSLASDLTKGSRRKNLFGLEVGNDVLVFLDKSYIDSNRPEYVRDFCLVNKVGCQVGRGITLAEREGPFNHVLCKIIRVGNTLRAEQKPAFSGLIYTCEREDTKEELNVTNSDHIQLLDPNSKTYRQAMQAAKLAYSLNGFQHKTQLEENVTLTTEILSRDPKQIFKRFNFSNRLPTYSSRNTNATSTPEDRSYTFRKKMLFYCLNVQNHLWHIFNGIPPWRLELKISPPICLFLFSCWFMIGDMFKLHFVKNNYDKYFNIINLVVWLFLAMEWISENFIIRPNPSDYLNLVRSDKAYSPSTRRYMDIFHSILELIALILFIPEICEIFYSLSNKHSNAWYLKWSLLGAIKRIMNGDKREMWLGAIIVMLTRLRIVGVTRRYKQRVINNHYLKSEEDLAVVKKELKEIHETVKTETIEPLIDSNARYETYYASNKDVTKAPNIETALMVRKSYLNIIMIFLFTFRFYFINFIYYGDYNDLACNHGCAPDFANYLSEIRIESEHVKKKYGSSAACNFFNSSLNSSMNAYNARININSFLEGAKKMKFLEIDVPEMDYCDPSLGGNILNTFVSPDIRPKLIDNSTTIPVITENGTLGNVAVVVDQSFEVRRFARENICIQIFFMVFSLCLMMILRRDAKKFVLRPLARLLEIVSGYASNPLSEISHESLVYKKTNLDNSQNSQVFGDGSDDDDGSQDDEEEIVKYETEQLLYTITKITSLLRQCWGVAGSSIISSNLKRNEEKSLQVFNPIVPGREVHAIFGFVGIGDWGFLLRALSNDVMILINDIASVVHSEVARWGLEDKGQCNKNIGPVFLMVFRIGVDEDVRMKNWKAKNVIFKQTDENVDIQKSHRSLWSIETADLKDDDFHLRELPGIQKFADRAAIAMLKAYAGIHRDKYLKQFIDDARLANGNSKKPFYPKMTIGLDAGSAMEGAVGSIYKVDATYLGRHVNMASRMQSACKQFGVSFLCSNDFQQLLSPEAKKKFRHVDTCTVKGVQKPQPIYTYDARKIGVDFFLNVRDPQTADIEAKNYSPKIWNTDQDLLCMRRHVTTEFEEKFNIGRDLYLAGNWNKAVKALQEANEQMAQDAINYNNLEDDFDMSGIESNLATNNTNIIRRLLNVYGDGPSKCLINYMTELSCVAPATFKNEGCRALTSK
mmetsp:Transcript_1692/g.3587  ORF Transcript_1692/g.3587 Transcript_1692/m.3587 type:complete len:1367 (-) Transcript_1692:197-4297(-)